MARTETRKKTPPREDGRRPLTTYMFPETIRNLKVAALEEDRNAYEIVEEAVQDWLKARKSKRSK